MYTIKAYGPIRGVCADAGLWVVPNDVGAFCVSRGQAQYIKHNYDPPETPWVPLEIIPDEPEPEGQDPYKHPRVRRSAKGKPGVPGVGAEAKRKDADGS